MCVKDNNDDGFKVNEWAFFLESKEELSQWEFLEISDNSKDNFLLVLSDHKIKERATECERGKGIKHFLLLNLTDDDHYHTPPPSSSSTT